GDGFHNPQIDQQAKEKLECPIKKAIEYWRAAASSRIAKGGRNESHHSGPREREPYGTHQVGAGAGGASRGMLGRALLESGTTGLFAAGRRDNDDSGTAHRGTRRHNLGPPT